MASIPERLEALLSLRADDPSVDAILGYLHTKVLRSPMFASADKLAKLLRWLIEENLLNNCLGVSEITIANEFFCKRSYSPLVDGWIRVDMQDIRQRLEEYYRTLGRFDDIFIELPKEFPGPRGAYVARFSKRPTMQLATLPPIGIRPFQVWPKDQFLTQVATQIMRDTVAALNGKPGIVATQLPARGTPEALHFSGWILDTLMVQASSHIDTGSTLAAYCRLQTFGGDCRQLQCVPSLEVSGAANSLATLVIGWILK